MRLNAEILTICVPVAVPISFYLNTQYPVAVTYPSTHPPNSLPAYPPTPLPLTAETHRNHHAQVLHRTPRVPTTPGEDSGDWSGVFGVDACPSRECVAYCINISFRRARAVTVCAAP